MGGWGDLSRLGLTVRPFATLAPPEGNGSHWAFKASLTSTVEMLGTELRMIEARNIVVEMDVRPGDIRNDGLPRANARMQESEAVALSFDTEHGALRWATNEYGRWEANLRSIALTLQALRAVDRYGVSKRGEQYAGFKALPASTDPADSIQTRAQAEEYLARNWGGDVRRALRETHPDQGGDSDEFRKVVRARELVA